MTSDETLKLELILNGVEEQGVSCDITAWERDFVESFRERLEEYGERTRVSEKQWAILDRIYDKVVGP